MIHPNATLHYYKVRFLDTGHETLAMIDAENDDSIDIIGSDCPYHRKDIVLLEYICSGYKLDSYTDKLINTTKGTT